LRLAGDRVTEAMFQTHGCGATIAAGSMLTEMVRNRSVTDCLALSADQLVEALGGVPADKRQCPILAVTALRVALQENEETTDDTENTDKE
jgi:nitrogen fixation NifU-like protein